MAKANTRLLTADDLYRLERLSEPRISPDGEHVIYAVHTIDRTSEKERSSLWLVSTRRGPARRFTWGDHNDSSPRWSPDGEHILFVSDRGDEGPAPYVIPFRGGEARPLGGPKGMIGSLEWSPDGRRIACVVRPPGPDAVKLASQGVGSKKSLTERHFTRMLYKSDGAGYLPEERWHIWTIDVRTGRSKTVTEGDYDAGSPRWSPDGNRILFLANREPDADIRPVTNDLWIVDAEGGDPLKLDTPSGQKSSPVWSPDGTQVAWFGTEDPDSWWRDSRLYVMPIDRTSKPRDVLGQIEACAGLDVLNDTSAGPQVNDPVWSADGTRILFHLGRHGRTSIFEAMADGSLPPTPVIDEPAAVGPFSVDAGGEQIVFLRATLDEPGQLYTLRRKSARAKQLTRVNRWLNRIELGETEAAWVKSKGGHEIQGWIVRPPGFDPNGSAPAIVEIHGGPWAQYGFRFMHEFQVLAASGYVVGFCNPRGGRGYGEAHAKAIQNDWGNLDYADIMAWSDHLASLPGVDESRMGVTGGSYGGFLTNWIIGHTDRFKAAVTQRSVSNLISFWGSSDIGWLFTRPFAGKPPWEDFENLWRQSPIRWISNAKTPTLVIHSEQDLRCDKEQGVQVYWALRSLGVDTELVLFPEESHGLSRGGRTDRRIARLGHILRWFDRYMLTDSDQ